MKKQRKIGKADLTKSAFCVMIVLPLCGGVFFVPIYGSKGKSESRLCGACTMPERSASQREANLFRNQHNAAVCAKNLIQEVPTNASEDHFGMH